MFHHHHNPYKSQHLPTGQDQLAVSSVSQSWQAQHRFREQVEQGVPAPLTVHFQSKPQQSPVRLLPDRQAACPQRHQTRPSTCL